MKNLAYYLLFGSSLVLAGCNDKKGDPQTDTQEPAESTQFRVVVKATQSGKQTGTSARVTLSGIPIKSGNGVFMSAPIYPNSTQTVVIDKQWRKVDYPSKKIYVSLYYEDVLHSTFSAPTGTDKTEIDVSVDGGEPSRLLLNAAAFNDPSLRWKDAQGKTNVGIETTIAYK
jgi:hypothetical protein